MQTTNLRTSGVRVIGGSKTDIPLSEYSRKRHRLLIDHGMAAARSATSYPLRYPIRESRFVMKSIVVASTLIAASATAAPPPGTGFPGDPGRAFDGLPMPPGPRPPRPPEPPVARAPSIDLALEAAKAAVGACQGDTAG